MKRPDATIAWLATHISGRAVFSVTSTDALELIAYIAHLERRKAELEDGERRWSLFLAPLPSADPSDTLGVPDPVALRAPHEATKPPRYSVTRRADTRWDVYDNGDAKLVDLFTTEAQADAYARYMNDSNMRLPGA